MSLLAVIILVVGVAHQTNGEVCTWGWVIPSNGNTVTRSVGAPLNVIASVDDTAASGDVLTWKSDSTTLVIQTYDGSAFAETGKINDVVSTQSVGSSSAVNSLYGLSFSAAAGVLLTDNGKVVSIEHAGCDSGSTTFTGITLEVKYCDTGAFSSATASDTSNCGYNCARTFTCTGTSTTFTAICQQEATWSVTSSPCAGIREGALLGLVILCSILSATHLI